MTDKKAPEEKKVVIPEVLKLLKSGYTRYKADDLGYGSIQEHYKLTGVESKTLFAHPKLKNIKTKVPTLLIIEEEEEAGRPASLPTPPAPSAIVAPHVHTGNISPNPSVVIPEPASTGTFTPSLDSDEGLFA